MRPADEPFTVAEPQVVVTSSPDPDHSEHTKEQASSTPTGAFTKENEQMSARIIDVTVSADVAPVLPVRRSPRSLENTSPDETTVAPTGPRHIDVSKAEQEQQPEGLALQQDWEGHVGLNPAAHGLLERSAEALLRAAHARTRAGRYGAAHLSALQAATAILAVRGPGANNSGPRSVWRVLPELAPELGEWAEFFESSAELRVAVESGPKNLISTRTADDMVRDAQRFYHLVESILGVPYRELLPEALPACE